jgi:hypothetical protein
MGLFYGYVFFIGFLLWLVLRFFKSTVSLPQVWCTYGEKARGCGVWVRGYMPARHLA